MTQCLWALGREHPGQWPTRHSENTEKDRHPFTLSFIREMLQEVGEIQNTWLKDEVREECLRAERGGTRYAFTREVIRDFPLRRVSRLHACVTEKEVLELCDDYDRDRNEYFFDRHAQAFVFIMLYVRSGKLRFVPGVCELSFYSEMLYWGLESAHLDSCCQKRLDDRMSEIGLDSLSEAEEEPQSPAEAELTGRARWLEKMRKTFEEPNSSIAAQLLASISVIFVILSMVMLCASTLPDWDTARGTQWKSTGRK
ncbi:hypothetical protein WMY93_010439 [Mugilogobius chulae]|uniref:Potassium channel tetramerisation-type BTB domain-containing protein n=1 Tax=Mugilogobius chulae TaxID=88201 RepID=A0AAW0P7F0_9GOBI